METMKPISCAEAMQRLFAYLDQALSGEPLERLEEHLHECLECCDRLQFSRQLDEFAKARLHDAVVPPGLEARIRQAIEKN